MLPHHIITAVHFLILDVAHRLETPSPRVIGAAIFALNDNTTPGRSWGGVCSSMAVVAGVGFEPTTFRL